MVIASVRKLHAAAIKNDALLVLAHLADPVSADVNGKLVPQLWSQDNTRDFVKWKLSPLRTEGVTE